MGVLPEPVQLFAEQFPFLSEHFPLFLRLLGYGYEHPYLTVFTLLFLSGLGLPLPEEVSLLLGGYVTYWRMRARGFDMDEGIPLWPPQVANMVLTACLAILLGDLLIFFLGRWFGASILNHRFAQWILSRQNHDRIRRFYDRWGDRAVFFSRFVAGIRIGSYLLAGSSGVRPRTFLFMDGLGVLLSGPVSVWAAYRFGSQIDQVVIHVGRIFQSLVYVVALVALGAIWWHLRRARRASPPGTSPG